MAIKLAILCLLPWLIAAKDTKITEAELAKYDGTGKDGTIYLAINGTIYDVSASPAFYGPGGHYRQLPCPPNFTQKPTTDVNARPLHRQRRLSRLGL